MTDRIETVSFANEAGQRLYGTLHLPERPDPALPTVVLLSPGVKMRVGPGRLYVPLTQMLVAQGCTVLRFDFHGLGDSEGELAEPMLADVYNHIEVGRYVGDTLSAIGWLRHSRGCDKFILGGLCGGAITALLAARREPAIVGLLSLGMTVTLASNAAMPGKYMTSSGLDRRRRQYFAKLLSPTAWVRLLTFRSDYSVIWHSMKRMFVRGKPAAAAAAPSVKVDVEQRGNANPLFPPAFFDFLGRGGSALMIFSEKDRLHNEYKEKFELPFEERLAPVASKIEKHVIADANHVMSLGEWQREMVEKSRAWLTRTWAAS
jgi:pimeloyl-ACP methyl ester carboxylesterase